MWPFNKKSKSSSSVDRRLRRSLHSFLSAAVELERTLEEVGRAGRRPNADTPEWREAVRVTRQLGREILGRKEEEEEEEEEKGEAVVVARSLEEMAAELREGLRQGGGEEEGPDSNGGDDDSLEEEEEEEDVDDFCEVFGQSAAVRFLEERVALPARFPHLRANSSGRGGGVGGGGALLMGPPGTGKTALARMVVAKMGRGARAAYLSGTDVHLWNSSWNGVHSPDVFARARDSCADLVILDDLDILAASMGEGERGRRSFLRSAEAALSSRHAVLLGVTSAPWALGKELLALFADRAATELPREEDRRRMLERIFSSSSSSSSSSPVLLLVEEEEVAWLARQTEGFTGSDLSLLASEARIRAAVRRVDQEEEGEEGEEEVLLRVDLEKALKVIRPSVSREDLEKFRPFVTSW